MFFKEFLNNQDFKKITFITLDENNLAFIEKLRDFLINEGKIDKKIYLKSLNDSLEECKSSDSTILFSSLGESSSQNLRL